MKELHDLCSMCVNYMTKCTLEKIQSKHSDIWDGFMVRIDSCPDYVRVQIDHDEKK